MKRHPSNKELLDLVLEKDRAPRKVRDHIASCGECSVKLKAVNKIFLPSDISKLEPSPFLESRIRNSYRAILTEPGKTLTPLRGKLLKPLAYAAASVIIIIAAFFGYYYYESAGFRDLPLALKNIRGDIYIDDKNAGPFTLIKPGSAVRTGKDSFADLYYDNIYSVRLAGDTVIEIEKSLAKREPEGYRFAFNLRKGAIYANFFHNLNREYGLKYAFNTAQADVNSTGTEFFLQASGQGTMLIVREGQVMLESVDSGRELTAGQGKKYLVDTDIIINDIDDNDNSFIDSILNADALKQDGSLEKSPAPEKTAGGKDARSQKDKTAVMEKENPPEDNKVNDSEDKEKSQPRKQNSVEKADSETHKLRDEMKDTKKDLRKNRQSRKGMR